DPRATLLTETGDTYQELRGASLECDAELVRDPAQVLDVGVALALRYGPPASAADLRAALAPQTAKRVAIRFHPTRVSSWDHRKLG
ncbi:MAG: pyridoxamine 5'-phosphate oxidase, partial [Thermoleophilia bacterium]